MGRRDEAIEVWRAAIVLFDELEDRQHQGDTLLTLGVALFKSGQREAGLATYQAGLQLLEHPTVMQQVTRTLLAIQTRILGAGI
jgi:tetratricopeptide (TPR) repeat protein